MYWVLHLSGFAFIRFFVYRVNCKIWASLCTNTLSIVHSRRHHSFTFLFFMHWNMFSVIYKILFCSNCFTNFNSWFWFHNQNKYGTIIFYFICKTKSYPNLLLINSEVTMRIVIFDRDWRTFDQHTCIYLSHLYLMTSVYTRICFFGIAHNYL